MNETIFDRIHLIERYATKQEKVIINFILNHPVSDMILLSITEFSEKVGVGEATMLRFCRKLGLKGYSEFRFLLSQSATSDDTMEENEADKILEYMITALKSTHNLLDYSQITKAASLILKARHVYALGSGNSGVAAQEFCNKVLRYGVNCMYLADSHFQLIATSLLTSEDTLVLFSVSGGTQDMLEIAKRASASGVNLVIITNYLKSPLAGYATALLYVVAKSAPLNSGSMVAKVSQLYIIDVLSKEIYKQMGSLADENLRKAVFAAMDKEI
ncbi:MAG: ybbH 1 [Herbinix sp.]|jgi:DNA-binding MurR/RpiR family transcriptional regulator|nr:ybbH 1 [Herbinix sp.]